MTPKCKRKYPYKREAGINLNNFYIDEGDGARTEEHGKPLTWKTGGRGHEPNNVAKLAKYGNAFSPRTSRGSTALQRRVGSAQ